MQTRGPRLWLYCVIATALVALIGSAVSAGANVSRTAREIAASLVAPAQDPNAPGLEPLADGRTGEPEAQHVTAQVGLASWYGLQHQGRLTASGERFDEAKLTAAHRTLPLDTKVKVTNLENGRSIEVKVNDRGPYVAGRVLDVSTRAARELGMEQEGLALVRIEVLPPPQRLASAAAD